MMIFTFICESCGASYKPSSDLRFWIYEPSGEVSCDNCIPIGEGGRGCECTLYSIQDFEPIENEFLRYNCEGLYYYVDDYGRLPVCCEWDLLGESDEDYD